MRGLHTLDNRDTVQGGGPSVAVCLTDVSRRMETLHYVSSWGLISVQMSGKVSRSPHNANYVLNYEYRGTIHSLVVEH